MILRIQNDTLFSQNPQSFDYSHQGNFPPAFDYNHGGDQFNFQVYTFACCFSPKFF